MAANETTDLKYLRVRFFYREIQKYGFKHDFCLEVICYFFNIKSPPTVSRILCYEPSDELENIHADLDLQWIKGYIQKHLNKIENEKT